MQSNVDVRTTVRTAPPRVPYEAIARDILGTTYELSVVICGDTLARRINTQYRKKTYSPNVLSFPLDKHSGEIFLNVRKAKREAAELAIVSEVPRSATARAKRAASRPRRVPPKTLVSSASLRKRLAFLFIHACLHLKGYDHGDKMDALEIRYMRHHFKS